VKTGASHDAPVFTAPFDLTLFIFLFKLSDEPVYRWTDQECDQNENEKHFLPSDRKHGLTGKRAKYQAAKTSQP